MIGVDIDLDGENEIITGSASGIVEARKERSGNVIHKINMSSTVSKLFYKDFRM